MESFPFFPVTCSCHLFQKITAVTDSRGRCCTEWDDCFSCKVILFYKVIYWPCCNSPPDRIVKCSQFPSCVDFTGFNGIQNCVYCYYLSFFSKIALKHRPHYLYIWNKACLYLRLIKPSHHGSIYFFK